MITDYRLHHFTDLFLISSCWEVDTLYLHVSQRAFSCSLFILLIMFAAMEHSYERTVALLLSFEGVHYIYKLFECIKGDILVSAGSF